MTRLLNKVKKLNSRFSAFCAALFASGFVSLALVANSYAGSYATKFDSYGKSLYNGLARLIRGPFGWIAFALMCLVGLYEYFFGKRDTTTLVVTLVGIVILCIIAGTLKDAK